MASNQRNPHTSPEKTALSSEFILRSIFEYLTADEIFQCRQASKVFEDYCDEKEIFGELVLAKYLNETQEKWVLSNKIIKYSEDAVNFSRFFDIILDTTLRTGLKRLLIGNFLDCTTIFDYFEKPCQFDFKVLNQFVNLELLQINFKVIGAHTINLPNLLSLRIDLCSSKYHFRLKTPKLKHLSLIALRLVTIDHPSSITHITELSTCTKEELIPFKNLEHLSGHECIYGDFLYNGMLTDFKHLKHLNFDFKSAFFVKSKIEDAVRHILSEKTALKRDELKFYFNNVELINMDKFDEFTSIVKPINMTDNLIELFINVLKTSEEKELDKLRYQIKNYDLLADPFLIPYTLNYVELMRLTDSQPPDGFFVKFSGIRSIRVASKVDDEQNLICFLKRLPFIYELMFRNFASMTFFEQLPTICESLNLLRIEKNPTMINFDFLLRFKVLNEFLGDQVFPNSFDLALRAFKEMKWLKDLVFKQAKGKIFIRRPDVSKQLFNFEWYEGDYHDKKELFKQENVSYVQLIGILERLKSGTLVQQVAGPKSKKSKKKSKKGKKR